ncbi:arogenate dehydratase/prephenate dehydratase 6, chloroplastic-like protein [Tanacetum coccineum]
MLHNIRITYQGIPGAYSEGAVCKAFPNCESIPCDPFGVVFQDVELWIVDRAVLPIENSLEGSIHRNYDLLLRHRLHTVGEVQLPARHCLLALLGVDKEDLNRVSSHPQAFYNTTGAAESIAINNLRHYYITGL